MAYTGVNKSNRLSRKVSQKKPVGIFPRGYVLNLNQAYSSIASSALVEQPITQPTAPTTSTPVLVAEPSTTSESVPVSPKLQSLVSVEAPAIVLPTSTVTPTLPPLVVEPASTLSPASTTPNIPILIAEPASMTMATPTSPSSTIPTTEAPAPVFLGGGGGGGVMPSEPSATAEKGAMVTKDMATPKKMSNTTKLGIGILLIVAGYLVYQNRKQIFG